LRWGFAMIPLTWQVSIAEASCGDCNFGEKDTDIGAIIRAYFDDSADARRKRFAAIGGLIAASDPWLEFEKQWGCATYNLKGPFRSADCEAQRGVFDGWTVDQSRAFMKKLVNIILDSRLMAFGAVVPVDAYRAVFPSSSKHDLYLLAFKQMVVNMGRIGADLSSFSPETSEVKLWVEDGDEFPDSARAWHDLPRVQSWDHARFLTKFAAQDKGVMVLQGADLIAREAFKHADNRGVRKIRKPLEALKNRFSFHLWTRECLEYLRDRGGAENLELLTHWGQPEKPLQMIHFYGSTFDEC
jgi:hypothetical protein